MKLLMTLLAASLFLTACGHMGHKKGGCCGKMESTGNTSEGCGGGKGCKEH